MGNFQRQRKGERIVQWMIRSLHLDSRIHAITTWPSSWGGFSKCTWAPIAPCHIPRVHFLRIHFPEDVCMTVTPLWERYYFNSIILYNVFFIFSFPGLFPNFFFFLNSCFLVLEPVGFHSLSFGSSCLLTRQEFWLLYKEWSGGLIAYSMSLLVTHILSSRDLFSSLTLPMALW